MTEQERPEQDANLSGEFITHSAEETFELGRRLGELARRREIFLLNGELGAGKTVFAKGLAAGLDIDPGDVTSPSFTLINIHEGRLRFYHIDLYRLERSACEELGLEEIFEQDAVIAIEWAERLSAPFAGSVEVKMEYQTPGERRVTIRRR